MSNQKKKRSGTVSNSPLPLAIVAIFGAAAGLTFIVAEHSPRATKSGIENSVPIVEAELPSETTTEVTATTAESTESTTLTTVSETTESKPLPPGSVTGIKLSFTDAALKVGDDPVMPLVTMTPAEADDKSEKWESTDEKVAKVDNLGNITAVGAGSCVIRVTSVNNPAAFAEVKVSVVDPNKTVTAKTKTADGTTTASQTGGNTETTTAANTAAENTRADMQVIDGITYFDGVMIVNKTYTLPQSYNPGGMTADTRAAFAELQEAAKADGLTITSVSDFRSYETQDTLYHNYVARDGQAAADTFSARAGHSEHQTGMAMDICYAASWFDNTPETIWLAKNCYDYGFKIGRAHD